MKQLIIIMIIILNLNIIIFAQNNIIYENDLIIITQNRDRATEEQINISKQSLSEYKKNKDIQQLLLSISKYPTGESYFLLGDYFFINKEYYKAIEAYEISKELEYEKSYYSLYNIACAYSLLESYDDSYDFLMEALSAGYRHFDWLYKDNDLSNLMNSIEYGDWISFSIDKYREKYYTPPFEIVLNAYNNNLSFQDYSEQENDWNINTKIFDDNYRFSTLTNRSSIDPVALALLCFKENNLSFVITSEKVNELSEKIERRDIIFYITYKKNKNEIDHKAIEQAILTFSHRV